MTSNPERQFLLIPPNMAKLMDKLVSDYAAVVSEEPEEVRRLVEIAVLTRGVRMMTEQVDLEVATSRRMGWA